MKKERLKLHVPDKHDGDGTRDLSEAVAYTAVSHVLTASLRHLLRWQTLRQHAGVSRRNTAGVATLISVLLALVFVALLAGNSPSVPTASTAANNPVALMEKQSAVHRIARAQVNTQNIWPKAA